MIPTIGLIVSVYAVARLLTLHTFVPYPPGEDAKKRGNTQALVFFVSLLAAAAICFLAFALLKSGSEVNYEPPPPRLGLR